MKNNFDIELNAQIASDRKKISIDQARQEILDIMKKSKSNWGFELSIKHYLEIPSNQCGSKYGVDPIEPHHHIKE